MKWVFMNDIGIKAQPASGQRASIRRVEVREGSPMMPTGCMEVGYAIPPLLQAALSSPLRRQFHPGG